MEKAHRPLGRKILVTLEAIGALLPLALGVMAIFLGAALVALGEIRFGVLRNGRLCLRL